MMNAVATDVFAQAQEGFAVPLDPDLADALGAFSEDMPISYDDYSFTFGKAKAGTNKLPPYKLLSIDGIPISLTYKNGEFLIARGQ